MDSSIKEVFDLVLRWMHVIAGIMWVGNSMLFNWLDRNLEKVEGRRKEHVGRIWLLHSGAFYDVEKTMLAPGEMPATLHWFKWQSYTTWMTGFALLVLVYYLGDGAMLVDVQSGVTPGMAVALSLGTVVGSYAFYELTWRALGKRSERLAQILSLAGLAALVFWTTHTFSGRAAYMQVGAIFGTCMAGNVFMHIVPSQHELVNATNAGRDQDMSLSLRAKQRSIHNNYMTFPLIVLMVSNHFPTGYGNAHSGLLLGFLIVVGAGIRHILNIRFHFPSWIPALASVIVTGLVGLAFFFGVFAKRSEAVAGPHEPVAYARVEMVMQERCVPCHSQNPSDDTWRVAPAGVMFDTPAQVKAYVQRIKTRAVVSHTMPLGNKTHMTEEERTLLADWILGGAQVDK